jgi:hypothetical protein
MYHREEERVDSREFATATILGHPDVTVRCKITNFSRSGMCILMSREVPQGHAVKVDWDGHFLVGRVQRVVRSGGEYYVGLQLLHCSQWQDEPEVVQAGS